MSPDLALFGISSHHVSNLGVVHDLHKWCVGVVACIIFRLIPVLRCVDSCAQAQLRRLVPLLDRVLVERVAAKAQTTGGILLPEVAQHKLSEVRVYVFPFDTVVLHGDIFQDAQAPDGAPGAMTRGHNHHAFSERPCLLYTSPSPRD